MHDDLHSAEWVHRFGESNGGRANDSARHERQVDWVGYSATEAFCKIRNQLDEEAAQGKKNCAC